MEYICFGNIKSIPDAPRSIRLGCRWYCLSICFYSSLSISFVGASLFSFFSPRVNINLGLIFHSKLNINKFKNVYAVKVIAGNQIQLFEMMDVHQLKQFCNSEDCIPINEHLVKKKILFSSMSIHVLKLRYLQYSPSPQVKDWMTFFINLCPFIC